MLSYASSSMKKLDWTNYGFEYDNETKCYYPIIATENTTKNITNEKEEKVITAPKKRSKFTTKTKEQLTILERVFKLLKQQGYSKFNQRNRSCETPNTGLVFKEEKKQ